MMDGMIVQKSRDYSPALVFPYLTTTSATLSKSMARAFRDSAIIGMMSVAGLKFDNTGKFKIQPFLMADENKTWRKAASLSPDSIQANFSAADGDEKGKFTTMAGLTRNINGREQRIIVSADADFMSGMELSRGVPETANFWFDTALFGWLSNGEFPVDVTRPEAEDKHIRLKGSDMALMKAFFIWIIPFIIFIIGTILLVRRKKQ
jgi:ABC-2 type transport system permease protein